MQLMWGIQRPAWPKILSWGFYDWANSAFATSIMAAFFPVFFKQFWNAGSEVSQSTLRLGIANSLVGLLVFICAPVLGALADRGRTKKRMLGFFAFTGALATGALYFVGQGSWQLATLFYALASLGYFGGNIFYDSLLIGVAPEGKLDFVSGFGFALGYLGGGILLAFNILCIERFAWFGFASKGAAVQFAFLSVALWWALFSLPLFFGVSENSTTTTPSLAQLLRETLGNLHQTIRSIRSYRPLVLFLIAYFFYIDGVNTVIKMAVDYAMSIGMEGSGLILALLITQFVAFPAALGFALLGEKWGAKRGILLAIILYILILLWASTMQTTRDFYFMAAAVGCIQGGIQALSRSYYAKMIPKQREAEFFGFYNMVGKFSAILGPLLVGVVAATTNQPRLSILVIVLLFLAGAFFLTRKTA